MNTDRRTHDRQGTSPMIDYPTVYLCPYQVDVLCLQKDIYHITRCVYCTGTGLCTYHTQYSSSSFSSRLSTATPEDCHRHPKPNHHYPSTSTFTFTPLWTLEQSNAWSKVPRVPIKHLGQSLRMSSNQSESHTDPISIFFQGWSTAEWHLRTSSYICPCTS